MTRRLRALGLALLVAVFAMTAVVASSASAAGEQFHCTGSATGKCVITATSEEGTKAEFTSGEATISCTLHFRATMPEKTIEALTFLAEYTTGTCSLNTHVRVNHCAYVATSTTTSEVAPIHLECSGGSKIEVEITDLGCTLKYGEQTPTGGIKYTNVGGKVTAESNFSGLTFTKEGGFGCVFIGTTGSYKAKDIFGCYEDTGSDPPGGTDRTTSSYIHSIEVTCKHE